MLVFYARKGEILVLQVLSAAKQLMETIFGLYAIVGQSEYTVNRYRLHRHEPL